MLRKTFNTSELCILLVGGLLTNNWFVVKGFPRIFNEKRFHLEYPATTKYWWSSVYIKFAYYPTLSFYFSSIYTAKQKEWFYIKMHFTDIYIINEEFFKLEFLTEPM